MALLCILLCTIPMFFNIVCYFDVLARCCFTSFLYCSEMPLGSFVLSQKINLSLFGSAFFFLIRCYIFSHRMYFTVSCLLFMSAFESWVCCFYKVLEALWNQYVNVMNLIFILVSRALPIPSPSDVLLWNMHLLPINFLFLHQSASPFCLSFWKPNHVPWRCVSFILLHTFCI